LEHAVERAAAELNIGSQLVQLIGRKRTIARCCWSVGELDIAHLCDPAALRDQYAGYTDNTAADQPAVHTEGDVADVGVSQVGVNSKANHAARESLAVVVSLPAVGNPTTDATNPRVGSAYLTNEHVLGSR